MVGRREVQGFVIKGIERERASERPTERGTMTHRWPEHERRRKTCAHGYSRDHSFDRQVAMSGRRGQTSYLHGLLRPFSGRCFDNQEPEGASGVYLGDLNQSGTSKSALSVCFFGGGVVGTGKFWRSVYQNYVCHSGGPTKKMMES